jgi:hypothetical protein
MTISFIFFIYRLKFFSDLNFDCDSFKNCSIFAKLFFLENLNCNIIIYYFRLFLTLLPKSYISEYSSKLSQQGGTLGLVGLADLKDKPRMEMFASQMHQLIMKKLKLR